MTKRLQAIEDRVNVLGWLWGNFHEALFDLALSSGIPRFKDGEINPEFTEKFYEIAERLLALYEPVATVTVKHQKSKVYDAECHPNCDLFYLARCRIKAQLELDIPDLAKCPGPGTFKLVPVEVSDD